MGSLFPWLAGCCGHAPIRRTRFKRLCYARIVFSIVVTEVMRAPGSCGLFATPATHELKKNRPAELMTEFEEVHQQPSASPETLAAQADDRQQLMDSHRTQPLLEAMQVWSCRFRFAPFWVRLRFVPGYGSGQSGLRD